MSTIQELLNSATEPNAKAAATFAGPDNLDLEDALDEFPDIDQHHPGQYVKPNAPITEAMQKQIDGVIAFEDLRMDGREEMGLGRTRREDFQGETGMQASDVPEPYES